MIVLKTRAPAWCGVAALLAGLAAGLLGAVPGLAAPVAAPTAPTPTVAKASFPAAPVAALPALGLARDAVTVSGLSSGGYMAGQFHVAYSASLAGAAVLAGGPLACSRGSMVLAMLECSCPAAAGRTAALPQGFGPLACRLPSTTTLALRSDSALQLNRGQVDDPRHLQRQRVWLMAGAQDAVVPPALVAAQADFYRRHGVPAAALRLRTVAGAAHGLPTPDGPVACDTTASPYLTHCRDTDAAGELLAWLYAPPPAALNPPAAPRPEGLRAFDQRPYRSQPARDGLDDQGWLYVPEACAAQGGCRLHVVFHGCGQGRGFQVTDGQPMGRRFADGAGYQRWAESNRIVLLFPQVRAQDGLPGAPGYNPQGCWDFWGYTHPNTVLDGALAPYVRRDAPQLQAVKRMVDALLQRRRG